MKIKSQSEIKHFKNTEKRITKSLKTCHVWNCVEAYYYQQATTSET